MKAEVSKKLLRGAVKSARRAMSQAFMPVLDNLLIEASEDGSIRVAATNLEIAIEQIVQGTVSKAGSTTVPARTFDDLLGTLDGDTVSLSLEEGETLAISAAGSHSRIKCIPSMEFPPIPAAGMGGLDVQAEDLGKFLPLITLAASRERERRPLNGVNFHYGQHGLRVAATDGYRLSVWDATVLNADEHPAFNLTIPLKAAKEVQRIFGKDSSIVTIQADKERRLSFVSPDKRLVVQAFDDDRKYPPVGNVIPNACNTRFRLPLPALSTAARQAALFGLGMVFRAEDPADGVSISSESAELGNFSTTLEVKELEGKAVFSLNSNFAKGVLQEAEAAGATAVTLEAIASNAPVVLRFSGIGAEDEFLHIIMPMYL